VLYIRLPGGHMLRECTVLQTAPFFVIIAAGHPSFDKFKLHKRQGLRNDPGRDKSIPSRADFGNSAAPNLQTHDSGPLRENPSTRFR